MPKAFDEAFDEEEARAKLLANRIEAFYPEVIQAVKKHTHYRFEDMGSECLEKLYSGLDKEPFVFLNLDDDDVIVGETIMEIAESLDGLSSAPDPFSMLLFHKGKAIVWELVYGIKPIRYYVPLTPEQRKQNEEACKTRPATEDGKDPGQGIPDPTQLGS